MYLNSKGDTHMFERARDAIDRIPEDYADYTHASHGEPYQPDDTWLLEAEQF